MIELRPVGYFDRSGKSEHGEPSLQEIISDVPHPDEERITHYLRDGFGLWGCGGVERDILNPGAEIYLDLDIFTDGVWKWPAYLAYYVETYHARLPEQFVANMRANNWTVPAGLKASYYLPPRRNG